MPHRNLLHAMILAVFLQFKPVACAVGPSGVEEGDGAGYHLVVNS